MGYGHAQLLARVAHILARSFDDRALQQIVHMGIKNAAASHCNGCLCVCVDLRKLEV